jgi:hypothetical protein
MSDNKDLFDMKFPENLRFTKAQKRYVLKYVNDQMHSLASHLVREMLSKHRELHQEDSSRIGRQLALMDMVSMIYESLPDELKSEIVAQNKSGVDVEKIFNALKQIANEPMGKP